MEDNDTEIKNRISEKLQIAILVLTVIAICAFIIAIIVLVKNVDEIKKNPIVYGIDKYGFDSCTCFDSLNNYEDFYSTKKMEVIQNSSS